jgi:hypothetical protein
MRIGAALTMTLNLPYTTDLQCLLDLRRGGTGTIAFETMGDTAPVLPRLLAPCPALAHEADPARAALHPRCGTRRRMIAEAAQCADQPSRKLERRAPAPRRHRRGGGVTRMMAQTNQTPPAAPPRGRTRAPMMHGPGWCLPWWSLPRARLVTVAYHRTAAGIDPADGPIVKERVIYLSGDTSGAAQRARRDRHRDRRRFRFDTGGFIAGIERVSCARERLKHGLPM